MTEVPATCTVPLGEGRFGIAVKGEPIPGAEGTSKVLYVAPLFVSQGMQLTFVGEGIWGEIKEERQAREWIGHRLMLEVPHHPHVASWTPVNAGLVLQRRYVADLAEMEIPNWEVARLWLCDTTSGLRHLHRHSMVHCDLKPKNLMVGSDGRVRLIDFGDVRKVGTEENNHGGTKEWAAPERFDPAYVTQRSADIWSLALVARYLMGLGSLAPFQSDAWKDDGPASAETLAKLQEPKRDMGWPEGTSERLQEIVRRGVEVDPTRRPTVQEMEQVFLEMGNSIDGNGAAESDSGGCSPDSSSSS